MSVVIGTAGHIDHGKTTLVRALTGVDTDRLPDEKRRGITIDIGFAELRAGDESVSFIDVPGHERFVRNMLAGASGIDVVMLIVAADDGVMPQTREHFEICRLLGSEAGVIVITKASLVESAMIDLVRDEVNELIAGSFLENANVFVTDAQTMRGIDDLRKHLLKFSCDRTAALHKAFRLPIDRVFSQKGFGTIVTGTIAAGRIREGDEVELYPLDKKARVRGLQNHDRKIEEASPGMRLAVNLAGVERSDLARGMVVGAVAAFETANVFDASVEVCHGARPLKERQRVRVHIGTKELMARVSLFESQKEIPAGGRAFARFRLEGKTALLAGERFIVRSYSPVGTIAGGTVLDPQTSRRRLNKPAEFLTAIEGALSDTPHRMRTLVASKEAGGAMLTELAAFSGDLLSEIRAEMDKLAAAGEVVRCGEMFAITAVVESIESKILARLAERHAAEPLASGFRQEDLGKLGDRIAPSIVHEAISRLEERGKIAVEAELIRLASMGVSLSSSEQRFKDAFLHRLEAAGLEVPRYADLLSELTVKGSVSAITAEKLVRLLISDARVVKVSNEFYFSRKVMDALAARLQTLQTREIDVSKFKEITGVSRKYAIPILEYFDREKVTARKKDGTRVVI